MMAKSKTASDTLKKQAMVQALENSLGVVTTACRTVGISRDTHYRWMKADPEYAKQVNEMSEVALDFAESKLFKAIKNENTTATIFYLKTKGRHRGYVEGQEVTINPESVKPPTWFENENEAEEQK